METLDEIDALKKDINNFPWLIDARARRGGDAVYMDKYNHMIPPGRCTECLVLFFSFKHF